MSNSSINFNNTTIQLKTDTATNFTSDNPILAKGEMGVESDTNKFKFGDGVTGWNSLDYAGGGSVSTSTLNFKYGLYTLSADQTTNLLNNNHIEFDTSEGSLGGLSTGAGQADGIITLPAGKTYKATFGTCAVGTGNGSYGFRLYNLTSATYIGKENYKIPSTSASNCDGGNHALAIFTTTEETEIEVRISDQDISNINYLRTWLLIEEYGGY